MKKYIKEYTLKSWEEAVAKIHYLVSKKKKLYFRGHYDSKWKLESSIYRKIKSLSTSRGWREDTSIQKEKEIYNALKERFIYHYVRLSNYNNLNYDEEKLEAYLQHNGLPTGLLDWSYSPYVAAFFAFNTFQPVEKSPTYSSIWVLNWENIEWLALNHYKGTSVDYEEFCKVFENDAEIKKIYKSTSILNQIKLVNYIEYDNHNKRKLHQQGVFTKLFFRPDDIEIFLETNDFSVPEETLIKLNIKNSEYTNVIYDLSLMNVTPSALLDDPPSASMSAINDILLLNLNNIL